MQINSAFGTSIALVIGNIACNHKIIRLNDFKFIRLHRISVPTRTALLQIGNDHLVLTGHQIVQIFSNCRIGSPIPGPAVSIRSAASADIQNDIATITPHTVDMSQFSTQSNLAMHNNGLDHLTATCIGNLNLPYSTACYTCNCSSISYTGICTWSHPLIGIWSCTTAGYNSNSACVRCTIKSCT